MEQNTIAKVLKGIGVGVMVLGVLAGFMVIGSGKTILHGLLCWIAGFVSGMSMLGFAEIINLLEDSKQAQRYISHSLYQLKNANTAEISPPPATQEAAPAGAFWNCPKCGAKGTMDARFCWRCGTDRYWQQ